MQAYQRDFIRFAIDRGVLRFGEFTLKSGRDIPIEERHGDEVRAVMGKFVAPKKVKVYNPAFDVTPHELITAIITERGVFKRPCRKTLARLACSV